MRIDGSVALVTGANRGLGRAFARELAARGAAKVYGAARHPDMVTEPGVTPIALDITDAARFAQVARQCGGEPRPGPARLPGRPAEPQVVRRRDRDAHGKASCISPQHWPAGPVPPPRSRTATAGSTTRST
jgi:NAD(P)-dependent dehydrogenase (short-subunit alcohol dehydrogenase family)